ncbi:MAG: hypothetical protein M3137_18065 [Actinomycetota bacterium]|nr:hypothetical protein [Actinomycetota bacterium]
MRHVPDPDTRLAKLGAVVVRVDGVTRSLARLATAAAAVGAAGGAVLWWSTAGRRVTAASLVVLALCLVPTGWLLYVRLCLLALVKLPAKLGGVATRRGAGLMGTAPPEPSTERKADTDFQVSPGRLARARTLRGLARDYGDVVGSWATVAQLVTPTFWALTALALLAVPILVAAAAVAGLVAAFS